MRNSQAAVRLSGTEITLTELSALPDTRRLAEGLKLSVVGGNSCVLRIVSSGYEISSAYTQNIQPNETHS